MRLRLFFLTGSVVLFVTACGDGTGDADGGGADGGGNDAGGSDVCAGQPDGTDCGTSMVCIDGACESSRCGDGFVDSTRAEVCDDGNDIAFDGCEPGTCAFTCAADTECDDLRVCNGTETCTDHVCAAGAPPAAGTACTRTGGGDGVCRAGDCVDPGCGNGVVDGVEPCDDGNDVDGDGCDIDCTFSCEEDLDCNDGDVCNGDETCDVATHACAAGTAPDCADANACTSDECDPTSGCFNPLIDGDLDGHADEMLGACGDDCDDGDATVFEGAEELCDGQDNNCNGDTDEVAPTWYVDCDDDGFAAVTDGSRMGCTEPPASATGCGGGWTTVRPIDMASTDCRDTDDDVFPGQTLYFTGAIPGTTDDWDYNCDGAESTRYGCGPSDGSCGSRCEGGYLPASSENPNGCEFLCFGGSCLLRDWPRCGESALDQNCSNLGGFCRPLRGTTLAQQCR